MMLTTQNAFFKITFSSEKTTEEKIQIINPDENEDFMWIREEYSLDRVTNQIAEDFQDSAYDWEQGYIRGGDDEEEEDEVEDTGADCSVEAITEEEYLELKEEGHEEAHV